MRPAGRTPLLLLDEPPRGTAAPGQRHQELVLRICRERAAAGNAVADRAVADRAAVLQDGRIAVGGPPGSAGSTASPWKC